MCEAPEEMDFVEKTPTLAFTKERCLQQGFVLPSPVRALIPRERGLFGKPIPDLIENGLGRSSGSGLRSRAWFPLEMRLQFATNAPVGISKVIVDNRIRRF